MIKRKLKKAKIDLTIICFYSCVLALASCTRVAYILSLVCCVDRVISCVGFVPCVGCKLDFTFLITVITLGSTGSRLR